MQVFSSYALIEPSITLCDEGLRVSGEDGDIVNLRFNDEQLEEIYALIGAYLQDQDK